MVESPLDELRDRLDEYLQPYESPVENTEDM